MKVSFRRLEYSPNVEALVLTISDEKPEYVEDIGENIIIHYSEEGKAVEIEILDASDLLIPSMEAITAKAREKSL
ncbi:MAG: DUF2283 domain-containing protein [Candidatus Bathyarchaeia archaeon]